MKKLPLIGLAGVAVLAVAWFAGGDAGYWHRYWQALTATAPDRIAQTVTPRIALSGQPAAMPRASAESGCRPGLGGLRPLGRGTIRPLRRRVRGTLIA